MYSLCKDHLHCIERDRSELLPSTIFYTYCKNYTLIEIKNKSKDHEYIQNSIKLYNNIVHHNRVLYTIEAK